MTAIIMQSDKAILNQAWKLYRYSEIKDHQGLTDFLYSLEYPRAYAKSININSRRKISLTIPHHIQTNHVGTPISHWKPSSCLKLTISNQNYQATSCT